MRSRALVERRAWKALGALVVAAWLVSTSSDAQAPRLAQETRVARIEITDVLAVPRAHCGRVPAYATLSAAILMVEEGPPLDTDIRVRWLACGMPSLEALRVQLVDHRFRVRLTRDIAPSDRGHPEGSRAPYSVVGDPEPIP